MTKIDIETLKKHAYLLQEIFQEAFNARRISREMDNCDHIDDGQGMWTHKGLGRQAKDAHKIMTRTLENYNWDLEAFFNAAATPNIHLFEGRDLKEVYPLAFMEGRVGSQENLENYNNRIIDDKQIDQTAKAALNRIEEFSQEL